MYEIRGGTVRINRIAITADLTSCTAITPRSLSCFDLSSSAFQLKTKQSYHRVYLRKINVYGTFALPAGAIDDHVSKQYSVVCVVTNIYSRPGFELLKLIILIHLYIVPTVTNVIYRTGAGQSHTETLPGPVFFNTSPQNLKTHRR